MPSARMHFDEVYAEELARLRAKAAEDGYAAGHADGMLAADAAVAEIERVASERLVATQTLWTDQMTSAAQALSLAALRLDERTAPAIGELTDSVADATFLLVADLLGREVGASADPGLDAVQRALRLLPADAPVTVWLHPDDHARPGRGLGGSLARHGLLGAGSAVERAGAVAESGARRVDAQLGPALERVRAVLEA